MSDTKTGSRPAEELPPPRHWNERRLFLWAGIMVAVIFALSVVAIVVQNAENRGKGPFTQTVTIGAQRPPTEIEVIFHVTNTGTKAGRPDECTALLFDAKGNKTGSAGINLQREIPAKTTVDIPAIGTIGGAKAVRGIADCVNLSPQ